ncbi:MAG TPA: hypothetical protein VF006_02800 [Longimicrobium sp.]
MSMPARVAEARPTTAAAAPTSTALVPYAGDGEPRRVPGTEKPVNAHVLFYVLGYAGLSLILAGALLNGLAGRNLEVVSMFGVMFVGLGGFGVVIHTLYRPNERKVRHLLLALASLAATVAATLLLNHVTREIYAAAAVDRLQPLADALAKDPRIRVIGVMNGNVLLNGYYGLEDGPGTIEGEQGDRLLGDVLARDGISRDEYAAYQRWLEREGMVRARRTASTVAFAPAGRRPWLLYVAPGHALPPAHALLDDHGTHHSQPLGGPWYMVLDGRR